eukprot:TRINITY_DN4526_c0_g1_i1.p1 TRINITY_DN4526_c0_g1~~TRINITY_DN4526_c0_g1_i1.p1  ORF type:complete len:306 (+),score=102.28 TRINITY_DN4526_c0_g1_i1:49-966(+)
MTNNKLNILVLGASGFLGTQLALALRRRGHYVVGLVRDISKAKDLLIGEVDVIVGDSLEPSSYEQAVFHADVIVATTGNFSIPDFDLKTVQNVGAIVSKSNAAGNPKKRFIFTSGGLVYEASTTKIGEDAPLTTKGFLQGRIAAEKLTVSSQEYDGVVIRPPMIIGGSKGHYTTFFLQGEQGKVSVFGDGSTILADIHIDDMVEGYIKVIEAVASSVSGHYFHFSNDDCNTQLEIAKAYAEAAGYKGEVQTGAPWPLPLFDNHSILFDSTKAKSVLGWSASRHGTVKDAKILYRAWKAGSYPATF